MRNVLSQTGSFVRRTTAAACRSLCLRLTVGLVLVPAVAHAQPFSIDWHTIDGGGTGSSDDGQSGGFELAGTIGQHDAGTMAGGSFELSGGFWFAAGGDVVVVGACCVDDACYDGVPGAECTDFVCNVAEYHGPSFEGCYADADGNGVVNAADRGFISANIGSMDPVQICLMDLDGNGVVNAADRGFVSANIGLCNPLPDWQDGSGLNHGVPDTRFGITTFHGDGTTCSEVECP
jgi:hypothetical protein